MRLMLGYGGVPRLLVNVLHAPYDPKEHIFEFEVVNGAWRGKYIDGDIFLIKDKNSWNWNSNSHEYELDPVTETPYVTVLSDNQDRLRGDYRDVFHHFDDPDYVAPKPKPRKYDPIFDDDIPF